MSTLDLPLFEIKSIPGKGLAVVARINIVRGTRILCEKPLFKFRILEPPTLMEKLIAVELKKLAPVEQRQYLSLHNNFPGKHPFSGTFKTNALPCGPDATLAGVYPTICRINHSCTPNSKNTWNEETGFETIHATHFIRAGDEITIAYNISHPHNIRRAQLRSTFGFDCTCALCTRLLPELQASDARRRRMEELDQAIGNPLRAELRPEESLTNCHILVQLIEQEYGTSTHALVARAYYDAFQICILHGDQARARIFAENAYKTWLICEGEDSPDVRQTKAYSLDPTTHPTFEAISSKWRSGKDFPKGMDTQQFEKWLWRQGK